jgi:hypothetical protein
MGPTRRNLRPGLPALRRACNYYTTADSHLNRTERSTPRSRMLRAVLVGMLREAEQTWRRDKPWR